MENIKLTVIDREGVAHIIEGPTDMNLTVMELCKAYELPVEGRCGGMGMCATCQCYVESDLELPEPSDRELGILDEADNVKENSRLGCQLKLCDELHGAVLRLAPEGF